MIALYNKISEIFPEIILDKEDIDSPYLLMNEIIFWLESKEVDCNSVDIIKRIVEFDNWCINQEREEAADKDIPTIYIVGFYEHLFENKKLQNIIKHLRTRKDLIQSKDYLISWIGEDNYNSVLKQMK